MKTYIYILFLLAAIVQPLLAQDAPGTKTQPPYPALPYKVTYNASPAGGEVGLSVRDLSGSTAVAPGVKVHTAASLLYIETDRPADVDIVSISGSKIASFKAQAGTTARSLSPGMYILKVDSQVYKVVVR